MKRVIALAVSLIMALGLLAGCAKGKVTVGEDAKLLWYARINKQASNDAVFQRADEMAREKLGIGLDVVALDDYHNKIQIINASGEDYDIVYTSSVVNNYYKNVADGNLLELDDLLPEYAPKLYKMFGGDIWDAIRVEGKIYGVVNQQIAARAPCVVIPKNNLEILGIDKEKYANASLEDFDEYLRLVHEKTGEYVYMNDFWDAGGVQIYGMELISGGKLPGVIRVNEENPKIINQYETQEYKDYITLRSKWTKEGLTNPMYVSENDLTKFAGYEKNQIIPWLCMSNTYMPGLEQDYKTAYGVEMEVVTKSTPILNSYGLNSTMTGVNSETRYPEKSVEFLEMLHTDKDFYNLIAYGLEDVHYKKIGENRIEVLKDEPYSQPIWAIGNMFNAYLVEGQADNIWEETKKINDEAMRSPIIGFVPDLDEVQLEVANCNAAIDEYINVLNEGLMDAETTYDEFIKKLKTAGCDKLIENLNQQLDEWRSQQ